MREGSVPARFVATRVICRTQTSGLPTGKCHARSREVSLLSVP